MKALPPKGSIVAHVIPFHQFFDSEYIDEQSDVTRFFLNGCTFFSASIGRPKRFGHDTNVQAHGALPGGMQKDIQWVSILVDGATDDDVFEVSFVLACCPFASFECRSGSDRAVRVRGLRKKDYVGGDEVEFDSIRLHPFLQFEVRVRAPERLRGKYSRVSLHGPLLVASTE